MLYAQKISSLVHSIRKKEKIRVRQPLSKVSIPVKSINIENDIKSVEKIILSEVNVKQIEYVHDNSKIFIKKIKPNYRELGAIHGRNMKIVAERINTMTQDEINDLEKNEEINLLLDDKNLSLLLTQVEISFGEIEGKQVASNEIFTIALDTSIDNDLLSEGLAREFINKIQNERKNISLEVTDKIEIKIENKESFLIESLSKHKDFICNEVQAVKFVIVENINESKIMDLNIQNLESSSHIINYLINKL
jgi:isoleucyl-tRNA synthetase